MRIRKDLYWNWKSFLIAFVIAALINGFASAAAGIEQRKNTVWTTMWIYLTIEAWKYWRWKALLTYPTFLLLSVMVWLIMEKAGVAYSSWTNT